MYSTAALTSASDAAPPLGGIGGLPLTTEAVSAPAPCAINGEANRSGSAAAARLKDLLTPYRNGSCPVRVCYHNGAVSCEMRLGEDWRVRPDDALMRSLREWLRPENVQVVYP